MDFETFKKLYLGDYTSEGYDSGLEDGKEHRPKNRFRFFKAVHPVNLIWNFGNAWESFQRSYDKGYIDGERVRHDVFDDTANTANERIDTMHDTSLERQIALLENFENSLKTVYKQIESLNKKYKGQIDVLANLGFISNYVDTLNERYMTFDNKIENILSSIRQNLQTIEAQKRALITQLQASKG